MADTKPTEKKTVVLESHMSVTKVKASKETKMVRKLAPTSVISNSLKRESRDGLDPLLLQNLVISNNTLPLCIEAMEVNVDGTGHDIVASNDDVEVLVNEKIQAESFFKEPFPNVSMIKLRRELRRNLESTGNAYLELMYNLNGELITMRTLSPLYTKLGPLSDPVKVKRKIERNGQIIEIELMDRERSFVYQEEGSDPVYLIEFGSSQSINSADGTFSGNVADGKTADIPAVNRGNKVIHFKMNDDPNSCYGIPRWISQAPSVVGSRKAEEQNLNFFDAGGIPNVIVFVKGGAIAETTTHQLNGFLSGETKSGGRAAVVEVASTSGTLDKAGQVDVQVERFGSEASGDKMYASYDSRCEERVRLAFRLPALFIGKTSDYNYATAKVAYQVAEAQVFKPDRDEFDTVMNQIIAKELGLKTVAYKSRPITLNDVDAQLKAMEIVKQVVDPKEYVAEVARISNINVVYLEGKEFTTFRSLDGKTTNVAQPIDPNQPLTPVPANQPAKPAADNKTVNNPSAKTDEKKKLTAKQAMDLSVKLAAIAGVSDDGLDIDEEEAASVKQLFKSLDEEDQEAVSAQVSIRVFGTAGLLPTGIFS